MGAVPLNNMCAVPHIVSHILFLVAGFIVLIKGADWLVTGSVSLARRYRISELIIGLTIVAFGTSAPELVVNIISSLNKYSAADPSIINKYNAIAIGNIVGSNLFNLMFILGLSGLIFPLTVQVKTIWKEIPLSLLAALMILLLANDRLFYRDINRIGIIDGIILLVFFFVFIYYIFRNARAEEKLPELNYKTQKPQVTILLIIISLAALVVGSEIVVNKAIIIAEMLGISEKFIGLTIVAAGTSLPELATSAVAAFRKNSDIAIGNVIGSNIFNIYFILGVSAVIYPLNYNIRFNLDFIILSVATGLLFGTMFSGRKYKLDRWEAALLLSGYLVYIIYLWFAEKH
jgi:cation:H+ antiporter